MENSRSVPLTARINSQARYEYFQPVIKVYVNEIKELVANLTAGFAISGKVSLKKGSGCDDEKEP